MKSEEFNFAGVSEETKKTVMEKLEGFLTSSQIMDEIGKMVEEKYGISLGEITANLFSSTRDLTCILKKAETEAILESDKQEIREVIDGLNPVNCFYRDLSYSVFEFSENLNVSDSDIDKIVSAGV